MISRILVILIGFYRYAVSPLLHWLGGPGSGCRFQPSCSEYFAGAVREHGAARGLCLGVRRICRCHPWGGFGYDPVPSVVPPPVCSRPVTTLGSSQKL